MSAAIVRQDLNRYTVQEPRESKQPHCNIDAERNVLGAIMLDEHAEFMREHRVWETVTATLTPEDFYHHPHREILRSMQRLKAAGSHVSPGAVVADLRAHDRLNTVGGAAVVSDLTDECVLLPHYVDWVRLVADHAARRKIDTLARAIVYHVHDRSRPLPGMVAGMIAALNAVPLPGVEAPTLEADVDAYAAILSGDAPASAPPIPTGISDLDAALCGGLRHGAYYLGGLPGDGKTTLMLQVAAHIALSIGWVLVVSKEQDRAAVRDILIATLARLPLKLVVMARENPQATGLDAAQSARLMAALNVVHRLRVRVLDLSTQGCPRTIFDVVAVARSMRPSPVAVFIDNLGEMEARGNHGTRTDLATREKAQDLRAAKDLLKVPFVTLVHPTQEAVRGKGRLGISDIAGGGAIGQLCDGTIFLHDECRRPTRDHKKDPPTPGIVEIYTAKLRGPVSSAFCEVQRVTHEHRFASTRRRDEGGQLIDDDGPDAERIDPRASIVQARAPGPVSTGDDVLDRYGAGDGLPDVGGAPVFSGESGYLDLGPQDEAGAA